jgi:hypothetical protein
MSIGVFESMRAAERGRKKPRKDDALRPQLHIAYARLGQAAECQNDALDAIPHYRKALEVHPRGPAQEPLDSCYLSYGIPIIDVHDPTLQPYDRVLTAIASPEELSDAFRTIVTHVNANPVDAETVEMLNRAKIPQLFLGVINFQLESEVCVGIGLTLASYFMRCGGVWLNHKVIGTILTVFSSNQTVLVDCLRFLSYSPNILRLLRTLRVPRRLSQDVHPRAQQQRLHGGIRHPVPST